MLEYHIHGPSVRRHVAHRVAADADLAIVRHEKPGDDSQQRRLAATGWAEDREKAAVRDVERQGIDGGVGAVALGDAVDLEILLHHVELCNRRKNGDALIARRRTFA